MVFQQMRFLVLDGGKGRNTMGKEDEARFMKNLVIKLYQTMINQIQIISLKAFLGLVRKPLNYKGALGDFALRVFLRLLM